MDQETIDEFSKRRCGWLSPDGRLVACDLHDHLNVVKTLGVHLDVFERIAKLGEQESRDSADFTRDLAPDEHPGWHNYYSDAGDEREELRRRVVDQMYLDHWIRLYMWMRPREPMLHAEGVAEGIVPAMRRLNRLSKVLGAELKVNEATWKIEGLEGYTPKVDVY